MSRTATFLAAVLALAACLIILAATRREGAALTSNEPLALEREQSTLESVARQTPGERLGNDAARAPAEPDASASPVVKTAEGRSHLTGIVVDASGGHALPAFLLVVRQGLIEDTVWTNAEGLFATSVAFAPGALTVTLIDHPEIDPPDLPRRIPEVVQHMHPSAEPAVFEAAVGCTLPIDVDLPAGTSAADFRLELSCARLRDGGVYVAEAPLRAGWPRWARFGPWSDALPRDSDWGVKLRHVGGLWQGSATTPPVPDHGAEAVHIELVAGGRLVVRALDDAGPLLDSIDDWVTISDATRRNEFGGPWTRDADPLDVERPAEGLVGPGLYVFDELASATYEIELNARRYLTASTSANVRVGATTHVDLPLRRRADLFDIGGIARTESGAFPPGVSWIAIESVDDSKCQFSTDLEASAMLSGGRVPFTIRQVPAGRYRLVVISSDDRLRWEPNEIVVAAGETELELVCDDVVEPGPTIEFTVVNGSSGLPIPHALIEMRFTEDGVPRRQQHYCDGQGYRLLGQPKGAFDWVVRAPSHKASWGGAPDVDAGGRATVRLDAGWGQELRLVGPDGPVPDVQILLDGFERGTTDSGGELRLELDGPPTTIALGDARWRITGGDVVPETGELIGSLDALELRVEPAR